MEIFKGEFHIYVQQVITGAKPIAVCSMTKKQIEYAKNYINKYYKGRIKLYINNQDVWIYKHEYLLKVIKSLPEQPKTTFDHWILGKAFGYSDDSIGEFLKHV